jgi:DHA1 family bicyclomycin/chloramphenicol resistance-like MFS transporter
MLAPAASPPRFATLVALTAVSTLSLNMFLPSLAQMAADFGVEYATMNIAVAGYLAITAVLQLILGPVSDRYGRRPVMLVAVAVFACASAVCALTDDVGVFLVSRLVQGVIVAGWALSLAAIRDTSDPGRAAARIGAVGMAMALAPMLGPMIGGALDEAFGWRAAFVLYVVLGAALVAVVWADMGETHPDPSADFTQQFRGYPELIGSKRFWAYAVCSASSTGGFYTFLSGAPLVAVVLLDVSPAELGVYIGTITGGFLVGNFFSARYAERAGLTPMMIAGRIVACAGLCGGLIAFAFGVVTPLSVFGATVFVGLGNGLTMPSSNAGTLSVRPNLAGSAAGFSGAMTVGFGAALSWITGLTVTAETGAPALVGLMLACTAMGLIAALAAHRLERRAAAMQAASAP